MKTKMDKKNKKLLINLLQMLSKDKFDIDNLLVVYRSNGYVHRCLIGDPMVNLGLLAYGLIDDKKYHIEDGRSKKIEKGKLNEKDKI